jgi:hypothetical protein
MLSNVNLQRGLSRPEPVPTPHLKPELRNLLSQSRTTVEVCIIQVNPPEEIRFSLYKTGGQQ